MQKQRSKSATQRLTALLAIVVAVGCDRSATKVDQPQADESVIEVAEVSPEEQKQRLDELFGGSKEMARMRSAKSIVVYRVASMPYDHLTDEMKARANPCVAIGSFPIIELAVPMSAVDSKKVLDLLFNGTYLNYGIRDCIFQPVIALRFEYENDESTDVLLGFECHQITVLRGKIESHDEIYALPALAPLFSELFPADTELRRFAEAIQSDGAVE